jgi:hypothetical protein
VRELKSFARASARNSATPAKPSAHAAMREIDGLTIHQRASAYDARYAGARALLRCSLRHAPLSKRPVEPDPPNIPRCGLPDNLLRNIGMRGDDQAIQFAGYAGKIRIALCAFDFPGVRVDGKHFVTGLSQLAEYSIRCAVPSARYARDSDALSTEKIRN